MNEGSSRVAIVTGGVSGIGQATVAYLLDEGWRVVVADLDTPALAAARAVFSGRDNVRVEALDVTDEARVGRLVDDVDRTFGPVMGVVNSAGIAADHHVFDTSAALFRKILDVNVVGSFLVGQAAARRMATRNKGAIVNISSISGLRGSKGRSAYGASKGAVITLTQVMANDLAEDGIRVNAVAPGPTETPMVKAVHTDADRTLYHRFTPMNRYGEPREVASVITFLLDDKRASYVTGEVISVDGGFGGAGIIERD